MRKVFRGWHKLMASAQGRGIEDQLFRTLLRWFRAEMSPQFWDSFCEEVLTLRAVRDHCHRARPHWTECRIRSGGWNKIIASTRPPHDPGSLVYDSLFGFWTTWLAAWFPRCMPLGYIRKRVFLRVRSQLRQQLRDEGHAWWLV